MTIADNGKGFSVSEESEGLGLGNMQKRVKRIGGHLEINSGKDSGTEVRLTIPL